MHIAVQVSFKETSYDASEGELFSVEIQKRGEVNVPVDVSFSVLSGTALGN